jgi:hypothetical protein
MNFHCKVGVSVSKTDNGYVLEWKDETKESMSRITSLDVKARGMEVFADKKSLMKRIEALL